MITLEFKNALVNHRFTYYNDYIYSQFQPLGLHVKDNDPELPYILKGQAATEKVHDASNGITEMHYSSHPNQLNRRVLTSGRMKEVLDGARYPLLFKVGNLNYLIGKGFLAHLRDNGTPVLLFVATYPGGKAALMMEDIKFYVCRLVYTETYKKIQPVIKDLITIHKGDVVITDEISKYIGHTITIPSFKSLTERKVYIDKLLDMCIDIIGSKVEKVVKPKPVESEAQVKKSVKKKKEAEILSAVRAPEPEAPILSATFNDLEDEEEDEDYADDYYDEEEDV